MPVCQENLGQIV